MVTKLDLESFFNSDAVALPRGGFDDSKEDFGGYLDRVFEGYLSQLDLLDDPTFPELASFVKATMARVEEFAVSIIILGATRSPPTKR